MKYYLPFLKRYSIEIALVVFSLFYSTWLMFSTFSYKNGSMYIATKAWSDFASHIPLIRSFSFGFNFPPQYPLFPGEPIHYHFLFYMMVGILEKFGVRIDFALNILSIIGFSGLMITIFYFAILLFKSKVVGLLSVLFFLLNGSLSFIYFFKSHPLSIHTANDVITNTKFSSFGPYDNGIVSAFWNMNIFTNQRHFAFSLALSLIIIFVFIKPIFKKTNLSLKTAAILGVTLGLSFFFHIALFLMTGILVLLLSIGFKSLRLPGLTLLLIAGFIAFPQYHYLNSGTAGSYKTLFVPGYLVSSKLTVLTVFWYWFNNLGLHLFLIPVGFILAPRNVKKILLVFFSLFIIGNTFQFSSEMAANHKFFNYFLIVGEMFTSYALVRMWKFSILKPFVFLSTIFLILSGVLDFFPVWNDSRLALADYPQNQDIKWVMKNTSPSSIILNTSYLYTVPSLAGRRIFLGWPYFSWSQGYDTTKRSEEIKAFFQLSDKPSICAFLTKNNISYVYLETSSEDFPFDKTLWKDTFKSQYTNSSSNTNIINVHDLCK